MARLADNIPGRTGPYRPLLSHEQRVLLAAVRQARRTAEDAQLAVDRAVADAWLAGISQAAIGAALGYAKRHSGTIGAGRILDRELTRRRQDARRPRATA
jgi:hypothetical protein